MLKKLKVDLFSDTATRPSLDMREFMAKAEVGDEQLGEDPSVNKLQEKVADLLGKEEALYLPSGLMANQIAFAVFCKSGEEIIMEKSAHPLHYEGGAVAIISGASIKALAGEKGIFTALQVDKAIRPNGYHAPITRLVSIEQTANLAGGCIWPLARIKEVCLLAKKKGLFCHMDGARLLNAVVATGINAKDYAVFFDSVWIDLSKGLGAPVGSVLAGTKEFISEAKYWKHRLGGSMRQAGIIAAGGIYALDHNIERLEIDHENAQILATGISQIPSLSIDINTVETNIVIFKVKTMKAKELSAKLLAKGVRLSLLDEKTLRAVTHLDIRKEDIDYTLKVIQDVFTD